MMKVAEFLNTRGGAIVVLILMVVLGALFAKWGILKSEDMFHDSFIGLLAILSPSAIAAMTKKPDPEPPSAH